MSVAKVEHAPAAPHAADAHAERRKASGAEKAMAWGIGLGAGSYPLAWLAAAAGSVVFGALAVGAWFAGSVLALGGLAAHAFRKK